MKGPTWGHGTVPAATVCPEGRRPALRIRVRNAACREGVEDRLESPRHSLRLLLTWVGNGHRIRRVDGSVDATFPAPGSETRSEPPLIDLTTHRASRASGTCAFSSGSSSPTTTRIDDDPLDEIRGLAKTAGLHVAGTMLQKRQQVDIATYIGSGKVEELKELVAGSRGRRRRLRQRPRPRPDAKPREGPRGQGRRPDRGDPRHLRHPRPDPRGPPPGGAGPARVRDAPAQADVDPPLALQGGHRRPRPRREAARGRPPAGRPPDPGAEGASSPRSRRGRSARSPAGPTCRPSRWSATPTPARAPS